MNTPLCRLCKDRLTDVNWSVSCKQGNHRICKTCSCEQVATWKQANPERVQETQKRWAILNTTKVKTSQTKSRKKRGILPFSENKKCPTFLGVHVAERVLSYVFRDVKRMPMNNPGFDFICNRGKKIDVKSSCTRKDHGWDFRIKRNPIADYFLCLAFDNRDALNPLHVWLLPANQFNQFVGISIRPSTLNKWAMYKLSMTQIITCCDTIRGNK